MIKDKLVNTLKVECSEGLTFVDVWSILDENENHDYYELYENGTCLNEGTPIYGSEPTKEFIEENFKEFFSTT